MKWVLELGDLAYGISDHLPKFPNLIQFTVDINVSKIDRSWFLCSTIQPAYSPIATTAIGLC